MLQVKVCEHALEQAQQRAAAASAAHAAAVQACAQLQGSFERSLQASAQTRLHVQRQLVTVNQQIVGRQQRCVEDSQHATLIARSVSVDSKSGKVLGGHAPTGDKLGVIAQRLHQRKLLAAAFKAWRLALAASSDASQRSLHHAFRTCAHRALSSWRNIAYTMKRAAEARVRACRVLRNAARRRAVLAEWRRQVLLQKRLLYCFLLARQAVAKRALQRAWCAWQMCLSMAIAKRYNKICAAAHWSTHLLRAALHALQGYAARKHWHRQVVAACRQLRSLRQLRAWRFVVQMRAHRRAAVTALCMRRAHTSIQCCLRAWHLHVQRLRLARAQAQRFAARADMRSKQHAWCLWQWRCSATQLLRRVFAQAAAAWSAWLEVRPAPCPRDSVPGERKSWS